MLIVWFVGCHAYDPSDYDIVALIVGYYDIVFMYVLLLSEDLLFNRFSINAFSEDISYEMGGGR